MEIARTDDPFPFDPADLLNPSADHSAAEKNDAARRQRYALAATHLRAAIALEPPLLSDRSLRPDDTLETHALLVDALDLAHEYATMREPSLDLFQLLYDPAPDRSYIFPIIVEMARQALTVGARNLAESDLIVAGGPQKLSPELQNLLFQMAQIHSPVGRRHCVAARRRGSRRRSERCDTAGACDRGRAGSNGRTSARRRRRGRSLVRFGRQGRRRASCDSAAAGRGERRFCARLGATAGGGAHRRRAVAAAAGRARNGAKAAEGR